MANLRVDSTVVGGLADGSSWANAFSDAQTAFTAMDVTTDVLWFEVNHDDSSIVGTSTQIYAKSTANDTNQVIAISIDKTTDQYVPATTAQIGSTNTTIQLTFSLCFLGMYLEGALRFAGAAAFHSRVIDGYLKTQVNLRIDGYNGRASALELVNSTLEQVNSSVWPRAGGTIRMQGGSLIGTGDAVYSLVRGDADRVLAEFEGVDCTGYTFQPTILRATDTTVECHVTFKNCPGTYPALATMINVGSNTSRLSSVVFINSEASGKQDQYSSVLLDGSTVETDESIYSDTGFSSYSSAAKLSRKITPVAGVGRLKPIAGEVLYGFVAATGSITFTMEIAHDFTSALTDQDFKLEVQALETPGSALLGMESSSSGIAGQLGSPVVAAVALASSAETWTGGGSLTKQTVSKTITVNAKGFFRVVPSLCIYEAGKVCHYDPKIRV